MRALGIDIGTSSIKVVEAIQTSKGVSILSYNEHPIGQNPAHDPQLEILEYLQALSQRVDPTQTKIVFGIRQERVSVRWKIFPFADRIKILKSLPFELEEDVPFSAETAIYDARVVRTRGPMAEVLACATPKHRIQEFLEAFEKSGLPVTILSAEGLAFANCFERWNDPIPVAPAIPELESEGQIPKRKLRLVLQLGHSHTLVTAFEDNSVVAVRSILWGAKQVIEAIARKYEIPLVDAERELRSKGFILPSKESASYDQIVFSDTISHAFRDLGQELKLSVLEIETELEGIVESAEITGGLSSVLHLSPFLTQILEVPVNPVRVLSAYHTQFEVTAAIDSSIGTALGLAIEGLRKPRNPGLQFLRGEFAVQNESLKVFWDTWGMALRTAVAMFLIFTVYSIIRDSMTESLISTADENIKKQATEVARLPKKQQTESGVTKYIKEKRKRAQEMKSLEGVFHMNSALDVLKRLNEVMPDRNALNVVIRNFQLQDHRLSLTGLVRDPGQKAALERALSQLASDRKVTSAQTPPPTANGVPFAYTLNVDRGVKQ